MKTNLPLLTLAWFVLAGLVVWQHFRIRDLVLQAKANATELEKTNQQIRLHERRLEFVTTAFSDSAILSFEPLKIQK